MTQLTYIPETTYLVFSVIDVAIIYYSFINEDLDYYTDILAGVAAAFLSGIMCYNSIIGIGVNDLAVDHYSSIPMAILFGAVCALMCIYSVVKIIELGKKEVEKL